MPEINIAPPPTPASRSAGPAVPAADPAVQGPGATPGTSQGASEDKGASSFAQVLKQQIEEGKPGKAPTAQTQAIPRGELATEPALPVETPPADAMASLLPMIFGNIGATPKAQEPTATEAPAAGLLPGIPEIPAAAIAAPVAAAPASSLPSAPGLTEQDGQPSGNVT